MSRSFPVRVLVYEHSTVRINQVLIIRAEWIAPHPERPCSPAASATAQGTRNGATQTVPGTRRASGPGPPRRVSLTVPVHSRSIPSGQRKKNKQETVRACLFASASSSFSVSSVCVRDLEETNQPKTGDWMDLYVPELSAYVHERSPAQSLFSSSVPARPRPSSARCHGKRSTKGTGSTPSQ
jgi:hypothetical protein